MAAKRSIVSGPLLSWCSFSDNSAIKKDCEFEPTFRGQGDKIRPKKSDCNSIWKIPWNFAETYYKNWLIIFETFSEAIVNSFTFNI